MDRSKTGLLIGILTLVFFLFMPYTKEFIGYCSVVDLIDLVGFWELFFEQGIPGYASFGVLGAILNVIVGGLIGSSDKICNSSLVGGIAMLVFIFAIDGGTDAVGSGVWFTLAGFVVNFFISAEG